MAVALCRILCKKETHDPITLKHGESVTLGRGPLTKIQDKKVSRQQVKLTADCDKQTVTIEQLGGHASNVDGTELMKGKTTTALDGAELEILSGAYAHLVEFIHDDSVTTDTGSKHPSNMSKRKCDGDEAEGKDRKRVKADDDVVGNHSNEEEEEEEVEYKKQMEEKLREMKEFLKSSPVKDKPKIQDTDASAKLSMSTDIKPATESAWKEPDKTLWVYTSKGVQSRRKIAAFDIDGNIITTQSGKVFPTHPGDWKILYPDIPGRLKKMYTDERYKIVFFTNQMGVQKGKVKPDDLKNKLVNIVNKIGIPIQIFVSTGKGPYRKPGLGMWKYLREKENDQIEVDVKNSLFVGDAAGRPVGWMTGRKKDFSCSDRLFALNAGLSFYTPEEFFLKQKKAEFKLPEFDPRKLDKEGPLLSPPSAKIIPGSQEVIVCVGFPASGKTSFAKEYLVSKGYLHVNRDIMKTWQLCVKATDKALKQGKSVIVDNTSPDVDSRKRYLDCAKTHNVPCRCFQLTASFEHSKHNERFREMTDKSHAAINDMIFNSYKSKFSQPSLSEGFTEIVKVNFVPRFKSEKDKTLYTTFLLEK